MRHLQYTRPAWPCPSRSAISRALVGGSRLQKGHVALDHVRQEGADGLRSGVVQVVVGGVLQHAAVEEGPCQVVQRVLLAADRACHHLRVEVVRHLQAGRPGLLNRVNVARTSQNRLDVTPEILQPHCLCHRHEVLP